MTQEHTRRKLKAKLGDIILQTEIEYQFYLKYKRGVGKPSEYPRAPWRNAVLKTRQEWKDAVEQVKTLGLPLHPQAPKNWDSLAALDCILKRTNRTAHILDAGAVLFSVILPWLSLYGYRHLKGINLVFDRLVRRGPIGYEYGDITQTRFRKNTFDAITCLSVIEHGVNLEAYFKEMSRILKPNGILSTSTDYYVYSINVKGQMAYGVPIHIFSKDEIIAALSIAREFDLELTDAINLDCQKKVVRWKELDLDYTFLIFTLQKKNRK